MCLLAGAGVSAFSTGPTSRMARQRQRWSFSMAMAHTAGSMTEVLEQCGVLTSLR